MAKFWKHNVQGKKWQKELHSGIIYIQIENKGNKKAPPYLEMLPPTSGKWLHLGRCGG